MARNRSFVAHGDPRPPQWLSPGWNMPDIPSPFIPVSSVEDSRDLTDDDSGKVLIYDGAEDITLTAPEALSLGFNVGVMPLGDGNVVIDVSDDMVNESPYTTTGAQFGIMTVFVFAENRLIVGGITE